MTSREKKAEARRQKLANVNHRLFGKMITAPATGTVFNPRHYLADPGRFKDCLYWWRYKAQRAGVGEGLPAMLRESALEQAAQDTLQVFLDRDYEEAGITEDEPARAVMGAAAFMRQAFYRLPSEGDNPRTRRRRLWYPYNRAVNTGTPNPAAIVAATFNATEDRTALMGEGDDMPGEPVNVPGGPGGRGLTDGKMILADRTVREWVERDCYGELQEMAEVETYWKMDRKRGRAKTYRACVVTDGKPAPRNRHKPATKPAAGRQRESGERCMIPVYAPDVEAYRAALAEYYGGR
jgi:hypothetical protein